MRNLFITTALLSLVACSSQERKEASGYTQGTTYSVIYYDEGTDLQYQIDSLLLSFDRILSTYQETSYISKWNRNETESIAQPQLFKDVVKRAAEVNELSEGAFDITVSPLMAYWFGNNWNVSKVDSTVIDSLMKAVGMNNVVLNGNDYGKANAQTKLDVDAIAQGFSVDVVGQYLQSKGIQNYLVEIGGEVAAKGTKADGSSWMVGIDVPQEGKTAERKLAMSVKLDNKALATSGNYRKFVEINGVKYGHSLNPLTGYPATTDVLSATIIAEDCMTADAMATACMVMGVEKAKSMIGKNPSLQGILIYGTPSGMETWVSPELQPLLTE